MPNTEKQINKRMLVRDGISFSLVFFYFAEEGIFMFNNSFNQRLLSMGLGDALFLSITCSNLKETSLVDRSYCTVTPFVHFFCVSSNGFVKVTETILKAFEKCIEDPIV